MDPKAEPAAAGLGGGGDDNSREDTFYLPADFPGADAIKEGDTVTLKVVSKGQDGEIEVEQVSGADEAEPDGDDTGTALGKYMAGPTK